MTNEPKACHRRFRQQSAGSTSFRTPGLPWPHQPAPCPVDNSNACGKPGTTFHLVLLPFQDQSLERQQMKIPDHAQRKHTSRVSSLCRSAGRCPCAHLQLCLPCPASGALRSCQKRQLPREPRRLRLEPIKNIPSPPCLQNRPERNAVQYQIGAGLVYGCTTSASTRSWQAAAVQKYASRTTTW